MNALTLILAIANLGLLTYLIRRPTPVGTFRTLRLEPEDLLVIQAERKITAAMAEALKDQLARATGTATNVIVMPPDFDFSVIRNALQQPTST